MRSPFFQTRFLLSIFLTSPVVYSETNTLPGRFDGKAPEPVFLNEFSWRLLPLAIQLLAIIASVSILGASSVKLF
ncbi:MAG: hypothetical protein WBF90_32690 [Rivularia sp. (in: cyanobacteria)]